MEASDSENEEQNPQKKLSRAQKEKEMRQIGYNKEIYTQPKDMYQALEKFSGAFKSVGRQHPEDPSISIIDFSLNLRGPKQDQIYAKYPFLKNNIRRGNTLIYDKKNKQVYWGRKGLMKFFDILRGSLNKIIRQDQWGLHKKDKDIHMAIFGQIGKVIPQNPQKKKSNIVHLYKLNKANGENAQVGYCQLTDQWVIASKNVSMLLHTRQNSKAYKGQQRYKFAILIADAWFNIIESMQEEQIVNLKKLLKDKTIVGQYCGNPDFQHLVKYQNVTIYFYAMVENKSQSTCLPPNIALKLLNQFHIPIVKNSEKSYYGSYTDIVQLAKGIEKMFSEVATASIFQEQQGSVLYFVAEKNTNKQGEPLQKPVFETICLGKLKTLQYRILRKLREKLKNVAQMKEQKKFEERYGSFQREVYELLGKEKLSKPIEYYFCIAMLAFDYVYKNRDSTEALYLLRQHYLDFLSVIFWCVQNKSQISVDKMKDEELHLKLRNTTWQQYGTGIIQQYGNMLNRFFPKYAKIKNTIQKE